MAKPTTTRDDLSMYSWARFAQLCAQHNVTMGYEGSGPSKTWDPDRAVEKVHGSSAYADILAAQGEQAALDAVIVTEYEPAYAARGQA